MGNNTKFTQGFTRFIFVIFPLLLANFSSLTFPLPPSPSLCRWTIQCTGRRRANSLVGKPSLAIIYQDNQSFLDSWLQNGFAHIKLPTSVTSSNQLSHPLKLNLRWSSANTLHSEVIQKSEHIGNALSYLKRIIHDRRKFNYLECCFVLFYTFSLISLFILLQYLMFSIIIFKFTKTLKRHYHVNVGTCILHC